MFFKDVKQYCFVRLCESDYVICWLSFVMLLSSLVFHLCLIILYVMGASLLLLGVGFFVHALPCVCLMAHYYNVWRHSGHYDHPPAQPVRRPNYHLRWPACHYVFSNAELERNSLLDFHPA